MGEDAAALKEMATQLAAMLKVQGDKGRDEWSQLHGKLAEVVAYTGTGDDPRTAVQALLKVAKDASFSQALMRALEERVSKANPGLLKDLVLRVAHELNMTPLADSKPVQMVNEDSEFCVDRIIKCSAELSAPNTPYAVVSIVGGQGGGKSYLLNQLFGTKFPVMDTTARRGRFWVRGSFNFYILFQLDTTFQKQATLFALTVSDLVIVNMSVSDIGLEQAVPTLLLRIIFQERTKLPQGFTKILVVVRFYDGEPPMETLRSNVQKSLEKIWESVHVEHLKFKDYIEVNIVGLPDKNSPKFPKEFYPRESIFPSNSSITSGPSSGHVEASSSTHSNAYLSAIEPRAMTFQELHRITDGFSKERLLGKGGFGMVYKGVFDNGEVIAVKKLHNNPVLVKDQFKNEVLNLIAVQHQNIIRLVGYSSEAQEIVAEHQGKKSLAYQEQRALCLEYMAGGTLEKLLSDESCGLDWEERYKIIKAICHGLKHLHMGSKDPIYHLDLKPANILLDEDRTPKIGDFGLSRLLASTGTFITQTNSGTLGYMPPEYIVGHEVSQKFDVFSLGVIMIEVMAGKNGYKNYKNDFIPSQEFTDHVTENWSKRVQAKPMSTEALLEVEKCMKMALRCVEDNRANRPTITEIVEELNMIDLHPADGGDETTPAALSIQGQA